MRPSGRIHSGKTAYCCLHTLSVLTGNGDGAGKESVCSEEEQDETWAKGLTLCMKMHFYGLCTMIEIKRSLWHNLELLNYVNQHVKK